MPVCEICSLKKDAPAPEASLHYGGADTTHGVRPILLGEGVLSQHQVSTDQKRAQKTLLAAYPPPPPCDPAALTIPRPLLLHSPPHPSIPYHTT